jgi:hypothetical protein
MAKCWEHGLTNRRLPESSFRAEYMASDVALKPTETKMRGVKADILQRSHGRNSKSLAKQARQGHLSIFALCYRGRIARIAGVVGAYRLLDRWSARSRYSAYRDQTQGPYGAPPKRCEKLFPSIPHENKWEGLSRPAEPEWLDEGIGLEAEFAEEMAEIQARFSSSED